MESPKKVTIKHLEFQLQREKASTREFEDKNKILHAQIARLEQEKAELRREKLLLSEEAKRVCKLEDRVHSLLKDIDAKDSIINTEKSKLASCRSEVDQVRANANSSIASWVAAEEEWIAEQASLKSEIDSLKQRVLEVQQRVDVCTREKDELNRALLSERKTTQKCQSDKHAMGEELSKLKELYNEAKNSNYELESKIYSIDMSVEKMKEVNLMKDETINNLETKNAQLLASEERMERNMNDLNDRLNVSKTKLLDAKSDIERLNCDVRDGVRRVQMLERELQTARHDECSAKQSLSAVQRALEESRDRCSVLTSNIQEKCNDVRRVELQVNEINAKLIKSEQQCVDLTFETSALRTELDALKVENIKLADLREAFECENKRLLSLTNAANSMVDCKEEELTLASARFNEQLLSHRNNLSALEEDVKKRQKMIDELNYQVREVNEKNALYFEQMQRESRTSAECRAQIEVMQATCQNVRSVNAYLTTLCDYLKSQANVQSESMLNRSVILSSMMKECYARITRQNEALKLNRDSMAQIKHELEQKSYELQQAACEVVRLEDVCSGATERVHSLKSELSQICTHNKEQAEEISRLQDERNLLQRKSTENADVVARLQQENAALVQSMSEARENSAHDRSSYLRTAGNVILLFDNHTDTCVTHLHSAHTLLVQEVDQMIVTMSRTLMKDHAASSEAEKRYRSILLDLQESRTLLCQQEVREGKRVEEAEARIVALQSELSIARSECERCTEQMNTLLEQIEENKRAAQNSENSLHDTVIKEVARRKAAEERCEKIHQGLNYELKRKCEYKSALEESKRLRAEVEECRNTEKNLAMQAIKKANAETLYWAKCFDKIKSTIESLRRRDIRVPSVDREALSRLRTLEIETAPTTAAHNIDGKENMKHLKRERSSSSAHI